MKILAVIGFLCVALGVAGMFIPLVPTTPFLLAACWLFMRSVPRYRQWILDNRYMGAYVRGYFNGEGFTTAQKVRILSMLWIVLTSSMIFATSLWLVRSVLILIGVGVSVHILTLNARRAAAKARLERTKSRVEVE